VEENVGQKCSMVCAARCAAEELSAIQGFETPKVKGKYTTHRWRKAMEQQPEAYKVKITIGDATVEVEGGESGVVRIVEAISRALRVSTTSEVPGEATIPSPTPPTQPGGPQIDIRSFFEQKPPSSDVEAATVAAYYYKYRAPEDQRRETINAETLEDAFRLARWPQPKRTLWTLQNARNAGYLDSAGDGQYRLSSVGYNLVEFTLGRAEEKTKQKRSRRPKARTIRKSGKGDVQ
jgi:hypothetical protein